VPDAFGTCHDIEVIGLVAMRDHDGMITTRHQDNVSVLDSHRLIDIARVAIDALEYEALGWVDAMVIGFLKQAFCGDVVYVVLVWRIA
jgi:hypothetical protein